MNTSRRRLLGGTMLALAVALGAVWMFVVRPAASDSTIGADDLVNGQVPRGTSDVRAEVGRPAPAVSLTGFDGGTITLASLRGKPTVINFWASSCTPCIKEMPLLERVHQRLGDTVNFVGVDVFESPELGTKMIATTGVTYPQTVDPTNEVLSTFAGTQLPHTVVLRADGTVSALHNTSITDERTLTDLIGDAS
ncbi:MAG: TlpA disulfide reductase family protein [Acidimicrobiales bacterium]